MKRYLSLINIFDWTPRFIEVAEMYKGKLSIVYYAYNKKTHELAKAYVEQEDTDYCSRKLGFNYCSGYRFFFSDCSTNILYKCKKGSCNIQSRGVLYTNEDLVALDPSLKYLVAKCGKKLLTMNDITLYHKHPELERVLQSSLKVYAYDSRLYKLKKPTISKLKNYFGNGGKPYPLTDVLAMIKFGCDYCDLEEQYFIEKVKNSGFDKETAKYLFSQKELYDRYGIIKDYKDYIEMGKFCGFDTASRGFRFPKDFRKAEEEMCNIKQKKIENTPLITKDKLNEFLKAFAGHKSKFSIFIPETRKDLVKISNELSNCVGHCSKYGNEMTEGKTLILVVCLDGKMLECCEFDLIKKKIVQLRGEHNQDSIYHKSCERYIYRGMAA